MGLVGILQVISQPDARFFALVGSRPSSLATNPVYFGAGSAAAAAAIAHAWGRGHLPDRAAANALGFFLACTNLAGSRGALVAALMAIVVAAARTAAERRIAIVVSAAIGWGASIAASAVFGGRDAAVRASSGSNGRLDVWRYGLEAFAERPVFGSGFGQFRAAVQGHFDATFVRDHASDTAAAAWPDAHNVIVQYAVVGGGGAVVLLVGFIAASARRARGPYAWAALTFGLTWLLQPVTLATGPLAMLCLGLAMSTDDEEHAGPARTLVGVPLVVGLLVGITLIGYDNRLNSTLRAGKVDAFTTWARRGPDDPVVAATTASLQTRFRSVDAGVEWSRLATRLEPWDAVARSTLAIRLLEAGNGAEAREQVARALELDPYNPVALRVARIIGDATDDAELAALAARRLDEIDE